MDDAFGMINMTTPSLGQDYFKGEIGTPNHTYLGLVVLIILIKVSIF